MTIAWVIGRGGLLGSALERRLRQCGADVFVPVAAFAWNDPSSLLPQLRAEVARFAAAAVHAPRWEIYWAAGIGTMGSPDASLQTETLALTTMLDALRESALPMQRGSLALASSAGAIYAGSVDPVVTEDTRERPTTAYGHVKLGQERIATHFASTTGVSLLIGRISTLYGSGQASAKQHGLLTHISRCLIHDVPVRIFVPLDTIRDYITADDAASMMTAALPLIGRRTVTKIIASERPATISEIVSIFKRLARRSPRIVTGSTPLTNLYSRRIQFRSIAVPRLVQEHRSLLVGIAQVLAAERLRHAVVAPRDRRSIP